MKISETLLPKFNDQITLEFASSMAYRQLAIEMDVQDLPGMAQWLRHQADEEVVHANKFIDHVVDRGNHPAIGNVPASVWLATTAPACCASTPNSASAPAAPRRTRIPDRSASQPPARFPSLGGWETPGRCTAHHFGTEVAPVLVSTRSQSMGLWRSW